MSNNRPTLRILGIRGIPASHGGFETFAEHLALYLVGRGWRVIVYCQEDGRGAATTDHWQGVERVRIPVAFGGSKGSIIFDWVAIRDAMRHDDLCLTLGYNTAVFCALLRAKGVRNVINMDGIEWSRAKWGLLAKAWFWLNERAGCWLGDHLVADHPEIMRHLTTRASAEKISMIAYGADALGDLPVSSVNALGLEPGKYMTLIARPEPENSILEVIDGFLRRPRGITLAVLGNYSPDVNEYHRRVLDFASGCAEIRFLGAIYDKPVVQALRKHSAAYIHGHQVGGTNPSLVEALGAGNAVLAHDNRFNRWVAGPKAGYFKDAAGFDSLLFDLLSDPPRLEDMRVAALSRFGSEFQWSNILAQYESLLHDQLF